MPGAVNSSTKRAGSMVISKTADLVTGDEEVGGKYSRNRPDTTAPAGAWRSTGKIVRKEPCTVISNGPSTRMLTPGSMTIFVNTTFNIALIRRTICGEGRIRHHLVQI